MWLRRSRPAKHPIEFDDTFNELTQTENIIAKSINDDEVSDSITNETETSNELNVQEKAEEVIVVSSPEQNTDTITIKSDNEVIEEEVVEEDNKVEVEGIDIKPSPQKMDFREDNSDQILHMVKKGETLYSVSKDYNVTVEDIIMWNNLKSSALAIGQDLKVFPIQNEVNNGKNLEYQDESYIYHEVMEGDTMFSISKKYDVEIDDLAVWNNKSDNTVKLGEKLRIKK